MQEIHSFPKSGKVNVSEKQGVYIIYNEEKKVLHVGKTDKRKKGLNQRLQNHLRNQSSFSKKYLVPESIDIRLVGCFKYIEVSDNRLRTFLEALTVGKLCQPMLGQERKK